MEISDLKTISEIVRSFAISIAVIIGGIWTLFTFNVLNRRKKAEAELRELEHKLSFEARLNITIDYEYFRNDSDIILFVTVVIENVGTRDTSIYFNSDRKPLAVKKINFKNQSNNQGGFMVEIGIPYDKTLTTLSRGSIVRPNEKLQLPFATLLGESGVYLAIFTALPKVEIFDQAKNLNLSTDELNALNWTSRKYINIQ